MAESCCPYLGLKDDPATYSAYPSLRNHCHRVRKPRAVNLSHQRSRCASPRYKSCPVYQKGSVSVSLPSGFQAEHRSTNWKAWQTGLVVLFTAGILFLGMRGLGWFPEFTAGETPKATHAVMAVPPSETPPPTATTRPAQTITPTNTPVLVTPTTVSSLTPPPFPTLGPALETPFGPEDRYLVHFVHKGESFTFLEERYGTTEEVIRTSNQLIPGVDLWPGTVLVVIPGETESVGLQPFKVIYVDQPLDLEDLADEFEVEPNRVRKFNSLGNGTLVQPGRWLILPAREGG